MRQFLAGPGRSANDIVITNAWRNSIEIYCCTLITVVTMMKVCAVHSVSVTTYPQLTFSDPQAIPVTAMCPLPNKIPVLDFLRIALSQIEAVDLDMITNTMLRHTVIRSRVPFARRSISTSLHTASKSTNAQLSIPNTRPEHISKRFDRLIGSSHLMRCIFYGVQDVAKDSKAKVDIAAEVVANSETKTAKAIVKDAKPSRFVPNRRPPHLSPGISKLFDRMPILQCIAFGVQETTVTTPSIAISANKSRARPVPKSLSQLPSKLKKAGRGVFKDLDIMTATLAVKGARYRSDVPTWY